MITDTVHMDVKKDTGDRPVMQLVVLIVSTRHVLVQMEAALKAVYQDTGETPAVTIAHKIVTIRPVPGMMGAVLAVNRIGKENSVAVSF